MSISCYTDVTLFPGVGDIELPLDNLEDMVSEFLGCRGKSEVVDIHAEPKVVVSLLDLVETWVAIGALKSYGGQEFHKPCFPTGTTLAKPVDRSYEPADHWFAIFIFFKSPGLPHVHVYPFFDKSVKVCGFDVGSAQM